MAPVKTVYLPLLGSRKKDKQPEQMMDRRDSLSQGPREKCAKPAGGEKVRSVFKVKLPKLRRSTVSKKAAIEDKTPRRWSLGPASDKTNTPVSRGGETQCNVCVYLLVN